MLPSIVRCVDRGHVLLSDGGGSTRMLPYTPCDLARRSLRVNNFHDKAKQIVSDAAGSGVSIAF